MKIQEMNPFRRRVPEVFQIEAAECGAASLCMILGYYGRYIELSEMRKDCHVSRDGSRMSDLMRAARKHGLEPKAFRALPQLPGRKLPLIAFWNYSHFLVVESISDKAVQLVDPAFGRRRVTPEEFARGFSGVVLELTPTDRFEPCGRPFRPLTPLLRLLRGNAGALWYLTALTTMINVVGLIFPAFTTLFVDYYLPSLKNANLEQYFLAFLAIILLQGLLLILRRKVSLRFRRIKSAEITRRITSRLLRLPVSYFGTRSHSVIDAHLNDIDSLTDFVSARAVPLLLDLVFSGLYVVLLFNYSAYLAALTLSLILLLTALVLGLLRLSRRAVIQSANSANEFYGTAVQQINLFETIKSIAMEDDALLETLRKYSTWQNASRASKKILAVIQAVPLAVPLLIQILVIAAGAAEIIRGDLTLGVVLACQTLAMSIFAPIVTAISEFSSLQGQRVRIKALEDIEREEEDPAFHRDAKTGLKAPEGEVALRGVSFGYNPAIPPVLEDISFRVEKGRSAAFVGSSGSGKSTILKLIEGLYGPQRGEILFDGVSQARIPRETLAGAIAVVSQTPLLFSGTVRENITLFDREIPMSEVAEAARAACVYDTIEAHPGGFNTRISPNEHAFSGGEIQRMMIARALVRKPRILILDEATSALDTVVEEQVVRNLLAMNITLLVVAHRLSAVRDCDEILVLQEGRIVQRGSHTTLSEQGGLYRDLMSTEESDEA